MMMASSNPSDGSELSSWKHKSDGGGTSSKGDLSPSGGVRELPVLTGRPSVRDLANKFEREAQLAASKAKSTEVDNLSGEAQFHKLKHILQELRVRFTGRNKEEVEKALGIAEGLEALYIQRGTELTQVQWQKKNLVLLLRGVTSDAKVMLDDVRAVALADIQALKETASQVQGILMEHEEITKSANQKELLQLKKEAHEARRIQFLHESSKHVDMEREMNGLRRQLAEKTAESTTLRRELELLQEREGEMRQEGAANRWYLLVGEPHLGSTLSIVPINDTVVDPANCTIQWYGVKADGAKELVPGAISPQYAPEPSDIGSTLLAEIVLPGGKTQTLETSAPVDDARGLSNYVESLASKGGASFNVRMVMKNGESIQKQQVFFFDINRTRIKLHKTHSVKAKEIYSASMQLYGAKVAGESAAQGLFWAPKKDLSFILVLESERERNAAIMLARKFAKAQNVELRGPGAMTK